MKSENQGNKKDMRSGGKEEVQLKLQGELFSQGYKEKSKLTSARIIHGDKNH